MILMIIPECMQIMSLYVNKMEVNMIVMMFLACIQIMLNKCLLFSNRSQLWRGSLLRYKLCVFFDWSGSQYEINDSPCMERIM